MPIRIEIQGTQELSNAFTELSRRIGDLTPIWPRVAQVFYERERQLFDQQGEGNWRELSPRYGAWKQKHFPGYPLLQRSTEMAVSLTNQTSPFSVLDMRPKNFAVGTSVPYAQFHQTGTSRMPARPPIIIDDGTIQRMLDVVTDELGKFASDQGFEVKK
jgi:phage gpG-like protein